MSHQRPAAERAPRLRLGARLPPPPDGPDFDRIRDEFDVPGAFPAEAEAEAEALAAGDAAAAGRADLTDLPLATVDPPGSRDLDQALHIGRDGPGYIVHYAIADVAAFVAADGALDRQAHQRVETYYLPDGRAPLHPPILAEGAASLLEGQSRPAVVWQMALDERGEVVDVDVRRALVASRRQWDYAGLQHAAASGVDTGGLALLGQVGALREALAARRGAIDLKLPEQIVQAAPDGRWTLALRADLPVEAWNAQISLMTGMCAAQLMLRAGVGILRTLPAADERSIQRLRDVAAKLGVPWPAQLRPGQLLAGLDRTDPLHVALIEEAATLLRGAGYTLIEGPSDGDDERYRHAGVAGPYAHVTAPLRRLVDRFASEACLAAAAGRTPPTWVLAALARLPSEMSAGDRRARAVDRAAIDATEAWVLRGRVGEEFGAAVIEASEDGTSGDIALSDPPVRARCSGSGLAPGARIRVRLVEADVAGRSVAFQSV